MKLSIFLTGILTQGIECVGRHSFVVVTQKQIVHKFRSQHIFWMIYWYVKETFVASTASLSLPPLQPSFTSLPTARRGREQNEGLYMLCLSLSPFS